MQATHATATLLRKLATEARPEDVLAIVTALESLRSRWTAADPIVAGLDVRDLVADMLAGVEASESSSPIAAYLAATALLHRTSRPEFELRAMSLLERVDASPAVHRAFAFARASEVSRGESKFDDASRWLQRAQSELDGLDVALDDHEVRGTRAFAALQLAALRTSLGQADEAIANCDIAQRWLDSAAPWPTGAETSRLHRFAKIRDLLLLNRLGSLLSASRFDALLRTIRDHGPVAAEYEAQVEVYEGHGLRARGEFENAERKLEHALAQPLLGAQPRAMAQLELALVHWDRGDRERARAGLAAARAHLEQHPNVVLPAIRLRALEVALAREDATTPEMLRACLANARAAWNDLLNAWDVTPTDGSGIGFLGFPHRRLMLGQLIELELAVDPGPGGIEAAFACVLEAQQRGTSSRRLGAPRVTLEDVRRELLGAQHGLLVYLPSWRGSHAFAIDAAGIVHAALPAHEDLGDRINDTLAELREGRSTAVLDALAPELLPQRIAERVERWTTVGIVGADLLRHLPIEALPLSKTERLGLAKNVYWLASLPAGVVLARRPTSNAVGGVRWIGSPTVAADVARRHALGPVVFDDKSRSSVLRSAGAIQFFEANEANADRMRAPVETLVLFAHGIYEATRARPNGIALAPTKSNTNGTLFFEDVSSLFDAGSAPRTVLLLACDTSRTTHKVGDDDSDQLGTAFLEAGVRCVAVSAEPLHQTATARLAAVFLQRRSQGATPAAAMKEARRELKRDARFSHPKYWSTLQLFGLADG